MALVIDGKAVAQRVRAEVAARVRELRAHGVAPGLAVVLVGEDPASQIYVRNKEKACAEAGIAAFDHRLPAATPEARAARRWCGGSTPIPPWTASWCSCRCPRPSTLASGARRDRARKGRGRLPSGERRPPA